MFAGFPSGRGGIWSPRGMTDSRAGEGLRACADHPFQASLWASPQPEMSLLNLPGATAWVWGAHTCSTHDGCERSLSDQLGPGAVLHPQVQVTDRQTVGSHLLVLVTRTSSSGSGTAGPGLRQRNQALAYFCSPSAPLSSAPRLRLAPLWGGKRATSSFQTK